MRQVDALGEEEGSYAVDHDQPLGQRMIGSLLEGAHPARVVEEADVEQLGDGVDKTGAADALRRDVAADDLELDRRAEVDAFDRTVGRPHAAADLAPLEGGTGRGRRRQRALGVADHDLAIGSDVDEEAQLVLPCDAGREYAGDDVGADVGAQRGERLDVAMRVDVEADLPHRHCQRLHEGGYEGHHADRRRVDAEQQVEHRRVADDDGFVGPLGTDASLLIEVVEDPVHRPHDGGLQLRDGARSVHPVADPGDDVGAVGRLAVERRLDRGGHPRPKVHQRPDQGRGANVEGDPEAFL